jgi:hypothetical protein
MKRRPLHTDRAVLVTWVPVAVIGQAPVEEGFS